MIRKKVTSVKSNTILSVSAAAIICGFAVFAEPVVHSPDAWDGNPLCWTADADGGFHVRGRGADMLVLKSGRMARATISARIVPEAGATNGWSTLGVCICDDGGNFWHAALVQAPSGAGGRRFFELCEMRGGKWRAQAVDGLRRTGFFEAGGWEYGKAYDLSIAVDPSGVRGDARDESGRILFSSCYAFPTAEASAAAVTCGRPALRATGGFCGTFRNMAVALSDPAPESAADSDPSFPQYESESFAPGVDDKATGLFHVVRKDDGRWWMIDPLGRGTVVAGVNHVKYHGHWSQRAKSNVYLEANRKRFPDKADWERDSIARLKAWGFNTLGSGCDAKLRHRGLAHTITLNAGNAMCGDWLPVDFRICQNERRPCTAFPNVFHPVFPAWCDYMARENCAPGKHDPWLLGYFIDNELAWWGRGAPDTGLFDAAAKLPADHAARRAVDALLAGRGVKGSVPRELKLEFLRLAAERYFATISAAIRRHDPNHLVLGARFAGIGGAHDAVWEICGRYCDVVTFNCYPWADLDRNAVMTGSSPFDGLASEAFSARYGIAKRPMLVTEWSFPALDSGLPCTGGAGQRFRTQALRTQASELFAKTMLSLPFLLGYNYFMWVDQPAEGISDAFPENSNYGLIDLHGNAYPEITAMFSRLHRDAAAWRRALPPRARPALPKQGVLAPRARALLHCGSGAECVRLADGGYSVSNGCGLVLSGRTGGGNVFDSVAVGGVEMGRFTGMVCFETGNGPQWKDFKSVVAAGWKDGALSVTAEAVGGRSRLEVEYAISVAPGRPWFLCELRRVVNTGDEPAAIRAFYFRQYAPYAGDKNLDSGLQMVPNLWKAQSCDAWFRRADGAFYGGFSSAPTVAAFRYRTSNDGKSQHPDAMFVPKEALTLAPGGSYRADGTIWFVSICGTGGGMAAWRSALENFGMNEWREER